MLPFKNGNKAKSFFSLIIQSGQKKCIMWSRGKVYEKFIIVIAILENEWLDGTIIISYFCGSNNVFADCK